MNTLISATVVFLKKMKVKHTLSGIKEALYSHPDFPSLLSVSDVLKDNYQVDNLTMRVENEKLHDIPVPFITYIQQEEGQLITVTQILNDFVYFEKPNGKAISINKDDFFKQWNNSVLIGENSGSSVEKDYKTNWLDERLRASKIALFYVLALGALFTVFFSNSNSSATYQWWLTNSTVLGILGVVICSLLLWYEIDKSNPLLQNICTGIAKTNCDAVLNSKASKLFNILSWSEVGFFYFAGNFILLLFGALSKNEHLYPSLFWLNLLALPYTIFSIYYQWKIAKQWCVLCLGVQAVLVFSFVNHLFLGDSLLPTFTFSILWVGIMLTSFLLPVMGWFILKPLFLKVNDAKRKNRQLLRLKFNKNVFEALLHKQKRIHIDPTGLGITIGNPNANHTIVKVCNPYCGPCAKAHPDIEKIIKENNNVKAQIIFTATADDVDKRSKPVKHLMAIASKGDLAETNRALDDWYLAPIKNYDLFAEKYPMNGELTKQDEKVKAMHQWCEKVGIEFTPTLFINGYQIPEIYLVKDIGYFLSE